MNSLILTDLGCFPYDGISFDIDAELPLNRCRSWISPDHKKLPTVPAAGTYILYKYVSPWQYKINFVEQIFSFYDM